MATNIVSHRIDWLVQFEAPHLSNTKQNYILADPLGDVHIDVRSGYTFIFNQCSYHDQFHICRFPIPTYEPEAD
jgi:hypothetical protein